MNATTEGPDDWRKREIRLLIARLLLGVIMIMALIVSAWLLLTVGITRQSSSMAGATLLLVSLSRVLFSLR